MIYTKQIIDYLHIYNSCYPRCLKTTEKVSLNIASKASYLYISSQKFMKNAKYSQTVLPDFIKTKIGEKCPKWKIQMRLLGWFSNIELPSMKWSDFCW